MARWTNLSESEIAAKSAKNRAARQAPVKPATIDQQPPIPSRSVWTADVLERFIESYPAKGKQWCIDNLGISEGQARSKAARLGLRAKGVSEAWKLSCKDHSARMSGRKRPEQAVVMKALHESGKLIKTPEQKLAVGARIKKWIAENGHPRGSLGIKHSAETRATIGEKSKANWAGMTTSKRREKTIKMMKTKAANGTLINHRPMTTWKAGWRVVGGRRIYFRSRWEANYGRFLSWLEDRNEIIDWEHEAETFWFDGVKRGCVSYLPDFKVEKKAGVFEYHEVKGWMDARSKTKIKRMAKYFPSVKLIVIDSKSYSALKRQMHAIIKDWE